MVDGIIATERVQESGDLWTFGHVPIYLCRIFIETNVRKKKMCQNNINMYIVYTILSLMFF